MDRNKVLLDILDFIIEEFNPCGIHGNICLIGENRCCFHTRFKEDAYCPHLKNGCTNPNHSCKAWYCETAINNMNSTCKNLIFAIEKVLIEHDLMEHPYLDEKYYGADKSIHSEK